MLIKRGILYKMFKTIYKAFMLNVLFLVLAMLMVSCGGGGGSGSGGAGNTGGGASKPGEITKLDRITISPLNSNIPVGNSIQYKAVAHYSTASNPDIESNITNVATWDSSNPSVATISDTGSALGMAYGETTITVNFQNKVESTSLIVSNYQPQLESITVEPANWNIKVGDSLNYTAIANFAGGSTRVVTNQSSWSSAKPSIASIDPVTGIAKGELAGNTDIIANYSGKSGKTDLTVIGDSENGLLIKTSTRLPYSLGLGNSIYAVFSVYNASKAEYNLNPSATVSSDGNVHSDLGNVSIDSGFIDACGKTILPGKTCNYHVKYTAPVNGVQNAGKLVDVSLNVGYDGGNIKGSSTTLIADGTMSLQAPNVPVKMLVIYNDDPTHTIYPVVETSRKLPDASGGVGNPDTWLSVYLAQPGQPTGNIYDYGLYRVYVGGKGGVPPSSYAIIALPLYSKFDKPHHVKDLNPKYAGDDNYIDWWRGTRVYLYDNQVSIKNRMNKFDFLVTDAFTQLQNTRICKLEDNKQATCNYVASTVYQDKNNASFPNGDPAQLLEFSIGGDGGGDPANGKPYKWDGINVDYDLSLVDSIYFLTTEEKIDYATPTRGYVGESTSIDQVQSEIHNSTFFKSLNANNLWPKYIMSKLNQPVLDSEGLGNDVKLPSGYAALADIHSQFFAAESPPDGMPNFALNRKDSSGSWINQNESSTWGFQNGIAQAWQNAINNANDPNNADAEKIWTAFAKNYHENCPLTSLDSNNISDVFFAAPFMNGFVQFSVCKDPKIEPHIAGVPLPNTQTTAGVELINAYHHLFRLGNVQEMNPWVNFIHNDLGLVYVYAFSIDDKLGNVQTPGDGIVMDISGTTGLENPNQQLPDGETVHINPGSHVNDADPYYITGANICGVKVMGQQLPNVAYPTVSGDMPIYLTEIGMGKTCQVTFDVVDKHDVAHSGILHYTVGFTLSNVTAGSQINAMIASNPDHGGNPNTATACKWLRGDRDPNHDYYDHPAFCSGVYAVANPRPENSYQDIQLP